MYKKKLLKIVIAGVITAGSAGYCHKLKGMYQCNIEGPGFSKPAVQVKISNNNWDMTFQGRWIVEDLKKDMKKGDYTRFKVMKNRNNYALNMQGKSNGSMINNNMMIFTYDENKDILNVLEMGQQLAYNKDKNIFTSCKK